ncbi:MAG: Ig-like domain-containing protein [Methyloglobulus sp.]|nr:polysaccharide deacetylase family protein [Methyloglobulus sp.]
MKSKTIHNGVLEFGRMILKPMVSAINMTLVAFAIIVGTTQSVEAANPRWLTLVSLTFDDGLTQSLARDILRTHNMHGTFYINSDLIGSGGTYLTRAELDALYADGNEIGGHTIGHVDLATLSDAAQKAAICNDMQALTNWNYQVYSLAYPYGSTGLSTQGILAAGCPGVGAYESGRTVGGLVTGTECFNCPWSESIPPGNPYYIATNNSVSSTTTLDDLKSYVTQAEINGGGWVPLVFHRICDGCSTLAVTPAIFDAFLDWLETRDVQGTYVRTVHQVIVGDYPAPPPPPALGSNELINPSLEIDADNNKQPDCWQRSNYGVNSATWTRTSDAHSGSFAQRLSMNSYTSGDRALLIAQDAGQPGGCAPKVVAGDLFQFSVWYKSTSAATPVLFYRAANGTWQYWRDGPQLPATSTWKRMVYYPGVVPAGAQALSFGIALDRLGTLTTDDYSIALVLDSPPPTDTTPPEVANFAPANGTTVTGSVTLSATASDNIALQRVEFLINGAIVATDTTTPYAVSWNSTTVANGNVSYVVRAVDFAGNEKTSTSRTLVASNDKVPPVVSFNQPPTPVSGSTVANLVTLAATASDNVAVAKVDFMVNGIVVGSSTVAPYQTSWNTFLSADGKATITAKVFDVAGNFAVTPTVNVNVLNNAGNLVKNPSLEIDSDTNGIADCWQRGGYGTNSYAWTRLNGAVNAHSGNFAESVQVTSFTSGDRKLVQLQDASTCAPVVTPGMRYALSGWYKATAPVGMTVFYRSSAGVWTYWLTSPNFVAANSWAKASYTTLPVPAGATAVSFGLYLNKEGTLITDDYAMALAP